LQEPCYDIEAFIEACGHGTVHIWADALEGALAFNLKSKARVMAFIANNGLERLRFINCTPFRVNPELNVDAYEFRTLGIKGYIAILYSGVTGKWSIKSFKLNRESHQAIRDAYLKAKGEISHE
jgi:hypothetical protein